MSEPAHCPDEPPITLVPTEEDPGRGVFAATLIWAQTGSETSARLGIDTKAPNGAPCKPTAIAAELTTADEVISNQTELAWHVEPGGTVRPQSFQLALDALGLVAAGQVPDAPGIADRSPRARALLEPRDEGGFDLVVVIESRTDQLHLANATLRKGP